MAGWRFNGTDDERQALAAIVSEMPGIQRVLRENARLGGTDRGAHQQQLAAGRVSFAAAAALPPALDGLGLFQPGARATGIGRISTGLGCPHLETDPDFLGLMVAFQTRNRERVDFLAINDPGAPTDTAAEFVALLAATAAAAGADIPFGTVGQLDVGNLTASQAKLFHALRQRLGLLRATELYLHIARQTGRTVLSSSAVQQYWTGVVEAGDTHGKFTFVPATNVNHHRALRPGAHYLTDDWRERCLAGDIAFDLRWIPYIDERTTPLEKNTHAWSETHAVSVGAVTFEQTDPASRDARLLALLAGAMGANPGNWVATRAGQAARDFPGTTFTAARQLGYALSQKTRSALPAATYQPFFDDNGVIGPELEAELLRYQETRAAPATPPDATQP